jgi:hypothetical protein
MRYGDGRIICPECGVDKCDRLLSTQYYPYRNKSEHLRLNRFLDPISLLGYTEYLKECKSCGFAWTDFETEDSQASVIKEHEYQCHKRYNKSDYYG